MTDAKIIAGYKLSYDEAIELSKKLPLPELCLMADRVRTHFLGREVDTCSIMNARSGRCSENCKWCAQSAHHNTGCEISDYVTVEDALKHAKYSKSKGIRRFSLVTSGRSVSDADIKKLAAAFSEMSKLGGIALCGSFGLLNEGQFRILKAAGMSRFHCNLETAPSKFPELCSTHTIEDKIQSIKAARRAGLSICSGGIIGMGETFEQRVELAATLSGLEVDSIPVNILQPIKGTPLESQPPLPQDEILKAFAVFRLLNPRAHIRFAGGRAAIRERQEEALKSGISAILMGDMLTTVILPWTKTLKCWTGWDMNTEEILAYDREHVWHPYASMRNPIKVWQVESARGVMLSLAGRRRGYRRNVIVVGCCPRIQQRAYKRGLKGRLQK
ncbi:MAG: biotin synthase BioB [Bacilli bacterium]